MEQALQRDHKPTLTAWFALNRQDVSDRQYRYVDIPKYYYFRNRRWNPRRKASAAIGRMYFVQPRDFKRYSPRLLLLHVKGATSFDHLKAVDGTTYPTFQAAARARGLLRNDGEWEDCLKEASLFQVSASQLRTLFALIIAQCQPSDPASLWNWFRDELSADSLYRRWQRLETEDMELSSDQKENSIIKHWGN